MPPLLGVFRNHPAPFVAVRDVLRRQEPFPCLRSWRYDSFSVMKWERRPLSIGRRSMNAFLGYRYGLHIHRAKGACDPPHHPETARTAGLGAGCVKTLVGLES